MSPRQNMEKEKLSINMKNKDQRILKETYLKMLNEIQGFEDENEGDFNSEDSPKEIQNKSLQKLKEIENKLNSGSLGIAFEELKKLVSQLEPTASQQFKDQENVTSPEEFLKQRMSLKFDNRDEDISSEFEGLESEEEEDNEQ